MEKSKWQIYEFQPEINQSKTNIFHTEINEELPDEPITEGNAVKCPICDREFAKFQ